MVLLIDTISLDPPPNYHKGIVLAFFAYSFSNCFNSGLTTKFSRFFETEITMQCFYNGSSVSA